ncbi:putative membrane protein [Escherichia phage JLBYU24]|nr:putative membrane protein [Escherichia phage JLBYU24]
MVGCASFSGSSWYSHLLRIFLKKLFTRLFLCGTITLSTTEEQKMKKIIKAIWNVVIILIVLSIFPIVLMIDVLNAYFGFM